ncbi:hypothetical protein GCM10027445_40570 [Amycolatopsis endophytica]
MVVTGALAVPLVLGAAGVASADTYHHGLMSSADENGVSYYEHTDSTGEDGAVSDTVSAHARPGEAGYYRVTAAAGDEGASFTVTGAEAGRSHTGLLGGLLGW